MVSLEAQQSQAGRLVAIRPPARCRILRILEKSERVVPFGTPIVVLGNPKKIEIVIDVLSTDAIKVELGSLVTIENWGGPAPLRARVRTVEPYGFTKVSALGIEEQRANVIADFVDSPDGLGDGYRVDTRIIIWESPSVLKVPASALFRVRQAWNVFVIDDGRTQLRPVEVGQRTLRKRFGKSELFSDRRPRTKQPSTKCQVDSGADWLPPSHRFTFLSRYRLPTQQVRRSGSGTYSAVIPGGKSRLSTAVVVRKPLKCQQQLRFLLDVLALQS